MLRAVWSALKQYAARQQHKRSLWCRALLLCSRRQQQRAFNTWRAAVRAASRQPGDGGSPAAAGQALDEADVQQEDSITALLGRMRQLRTTAAESMAACRAPASVAGEGAAHPSTSSQQWKAASIGNLTGSRVQLAAAGGQGGLGCGKEQAGLCFAAAARQCAAPLPVVKRPQPRPLPYWMGR